MAELSRFQRFSKKPLIGLRSLWLTVNSPESIRGIFLKVFGAGGATSFILSAVLAVLVLLVAVGVVTLSIATLGIAAAVIAGIGLFIVAVAEIFYANERYGKAKKKIVKKFEVEFEKENRNSELKEAVKEAVKPYEKRLKALEKSKEVEIEAEGDESSTTTTHTNTPNDAIIRDITSFFVPNNTSSKRNEAPAETKEEEEEGREKEDTPFDILVKSTLLHINVRYYQNSNYLVGRSDDRVNQVFELNKFIINLSKQGRSDPDKVEALILKLTKYKDKYKHNAFHRLFSRSHFVMAIERVLDKFQGSSVVSVDQENT